MKIKNCSLEQPVTWLLFLTETPLQGHWSCPCRMDQSSTTSLWLVLKRVSALVLMFFRLLRTLMFKMFLLNHKAFIKRQAPPPFLTALLILSTSRLCQEARQRGLLWQRILTHLSLPCLLPETAMNRCVCIGEIHHLEKKGFIVVTFCNTTHLSSHQATLGWWIKEPTLMQVLVLLLLLSTELWKAQTACQAQSLWRLVAKYIRCFRVHSAADCPLTQNNEIVLHLNTVRINREDYCEFFLYWVHDLVL